MRVQRILIIVFAAASAAVIGCGPRPASLDAVQLNPSGWIASDTAVMTFRVEHPDHRHNLQFGLRHSEDYPFSNLFLFVELEYPNGKTMLDTLECPLGAPDGRWYGEGHGWIDLRVGYKQAVAFPLQGDYTLRVLHAMRRDPLPGLAELRFSLFDLTEP